MDLKLMKIKKLDRNLNYAERLLEPSLYQTVYR